MHGPYETFGLTTESDIVTFVSLESLFRPRSIAVVGASAARGKAGNAMVRSLRDFPGDLYPVNPRADVIEGRQVYPSLAAVPAPLDLAVLVVPPPAVPAVLREAGQVRAGAAMVCAGGFGESGAEGAALQRAATAVAREHGIRLLGPNTSGFMNPPDRVLANFVPDVSRLRPGPVSFVAQSGGVNLALSFLADEAGVGIRLGVGLGNAVDVSFPDVLDHLADDDETRAVGLHVEGVADGRALCDAVRRLAEHKPVVALKVGRSDVADFARSHTGALTGDFALTRAALRQSGAVVVDDPTELVDAVQALAHVRLPPRRRAGVGVVTGQAGPGLIIADTLRSADVSVPQLRPPTVQRLSGLLPPVTYQRNPVDSGRPEETFPEVLRTVASDPGVDLLLVYALEEPDAVDPVEALGRSGIAVPVLFAGGGLRDALDERREALAAIDVPLYRAPERAARAARAVAADAAARHRLVGCPGPAVPGPPPRRLGPAVLDEDRAKAVLEEAGLRAPVRRVCDTRNGAHAALRELGAPVAVKVCDPALSHKTDVGGVHLGIRTARDLDDALDAIDRIAPGRSVRYLVERQAPPGPELIVGGLRDPSFGPVVLVGAGGTAAELVARSALRLAPLGRDDVEEMVCSLPAALLRGHRGARPVNTAEVVGAVLAVSSVLTTYADVVELDVNPLRLTDEGPLALDALLVLDSQDTGQGSATISTELPTELPTEEQIEKPDD